MSRTVIVCVFVSFLFLMACQKNHQSFESPFTSSNDALINKPTLNDTSDTLSYGDSVFSVSVVGADKIIFPVKRPSKFGYYTANLPGLDLDSISGRINLSRSESGLRYRVYFVSREKKIIATSAITIVGIDYQDRIYDLSSTLPENLYAVPIFDMNPGAPLPCDYSGNGLTCKFDETDLNGDFIPDYIGANNSKLIIDTTTGVIDLKKSFAAGVFGPVPAGANLTFLNGRKKDITIYYRLGDSNVRTLKKITVRLVYFQSRALIPESMQLEIDSRNQRYTLQPGSASSDDDQLYLLYYDSKPKRPPLIVIVAST